MTLFINSSFIGNQYLGCLRVALSSAQFWFTLILTLGILLIPFIAIRFYTFNLYPTLSDKVRLKQRLTRFKSAVKSQLPPMYYPHRRKSSVRRSRRSVRSGYAFSHQEGFGTLIMSGKLAQKPSGSTRGFTIGESLSNSLNSSNAAGVTFSNGSLSMPKITKVTGVAAMGNLAIASAGGLPIDSDNLLLEEPMKPKPLPTVKPKLKVAGSIDSETLNSQDSRSSRQNRKNLAKLKNTQQSTSLSNQSVHSTNGSTHSMKANSSSKQASLEDRSQGVESRQQKSSNSLENTNRKSLSNNQSHHQSSNSSSDKENDAKKEESSYVDGGYLNRQFTIDEQLDSIHSDSSNENAKHKSLNNSKPDLENVQENEKRPVSKSIENLTSRQKILTTEQRRSRLQNQLSQPTSNSTKKSKSHKNKGPSSIEI